MARLIDRVKNLWTDSLVDVKELWAPSEIQEATVLVNRLDQLHREDVERTVAPLNQKISELETELIETQEAAWEQHKYLSEQLRQREAEVESLTTKLVVAEEAHQLAEDIDQAIKKQQAGLEQTDEDSYATRGQYREAIEMLSNLKKHVLAGRIDVDLTTEISYEQDQIGIAQDKDSYESSVADAEPFIERAKALGHNVRVSQFPDGENRWDFVERWEERALADAEALTELVGDSMRTFIEGRGYSADNVPEDVLSEAVAHATSEIKEADAGVTARYIASDVLACQAETEPAESYSEGIGCGF